MPDNKPTEYSLSPAGTPKDTRGTPLSDLRIDPSAPSYKPVTNYGTGKPVNTPPNPSNAHIPPSVLREMLREAEAEHAFKHRYRKKKLFWIFFAIYAVCVSLSMLGGYESLSLGESLLLIGPSALMCIPFSAITAFINITLIVTIISDMRICIPYVSIAEI